MDEPNVIMRAKWAGDSKVLFPGCEVEILATDPQDPSVPGRRACWVRHWNRERDCPMYRSCDLSDLDVPDDFDFQSLPVCAVDPDAPAAIPVPAEGEGK